MEDIIIILRNSYIDKRPANLTAITLLGNQQVNIGLGVWKDVLSIVEWAAELGHGFPEEFVSRDYTRQIAEDYYNFLKEELNAKS